MNAKSVDEVFMILDDYWDYTNYELLQYLVEKFGESGLKKEMNKYVAELEEFEKKTTIQANDSAALNSTHRKRPMNDDYQFSIVDIHLPKDPEVSTLLLQPVTLESSPKISYLLHQPLPVNPQLLSQPIVHRLSNTRTSPTQCHLLNSTFLKLKPPTRRVCQDQVAQLQPSPT